MPFESQATSAGCTSGSLPLTQFINMITPLLIIAGCTFIGMSFIFGPLQAAIHTAVTAAVLAALWLAFVLASA